MSDELSMMPIAATRREVAAQPEVIARVLAEQSGAIRDLAVRLAARGTRQVVLLGSGDSWFAGMACRLAFETYSGLPAEAIQAYEYAAYGHASFDAATAAVVISSSGRPTTTWDALDRALATPAYVVGITDKPYAGNPFREKVHTAIVPGALKVGWPAQTTTATIAVLITLAIELGRARGYPGRGRGPGVYRTAAGAARADAARTGAERRVGRTTGARLAERGRAAHLHLCWRRAEPGRGLHRHGAAGRGAARVGIAIAAEEFTHGLHIATIARDDVVVAAGIRRREPPHARRGALGTHPQLVALVDTSDTAIGALAGSTLTLPEVPEPLTPPLTLLPLHQLSIALAEQKVAAGYQRPRAVP
ncbi:MAG: SIS domain-containing protein [Kouleothrix sp.]